MNDAPSHHVADASTHLILTACLGTDDMYEATLRKLTRAKLQRLAKANKIKANMKSGTIIQELLKLYKVVQLHQDEGNEEPLRKTGKTSMQDQPPSEPTRRTSGEIPLGAGPSTRIIDAVVDINREYHVSRSGTPLPERPEMLNRAVGIMNQITSDDQRILVQIAALCERAKMLREQAKNMRDVVRAEQGRRKRLEAYFT
ncbi:hypothetical protein EDD22DRAFT_938674, partial [Suillus occidentalis]